MKFRHFLEVLKDENELTITKKPVNLNIEAGALAAKCVALDGPALQFEAIDDYEGVASLVSGLYASPSDMYSRTRRPWIRLLLAMDQDKRMTYEEMQGYFDDALIQGGIKAIEVDRAIWDEKMEGDNVDLFRLPFPIIHELDAGRYSNMNTIIVEDPETRGHSWSGERFMLASKNSIAVRMINGSPLSTVYNKYQNIGKPMPFSIAIGVDSAIPIATAIFMEGITGPMSAADLAGYLGGEPIELFKSEANQLLVPANAEILIEGMAFPGETGTEGAFNGMIQYEAPSVQPVFRVTSIKYRKNCIIPFDVTGIKGSDSLTLKSIAHSFRLQKIMNILWMGYRAVKWVYCPISFRLGMAIASATPVYPGFEFLISRALFSCSHWFDKVLIVDTGCGAEELARIMGDVYQKASPVTAFILQDNSTRPYLKMLNIRPLRELQGGCILMLLLIPLGQRTCCQRGYLSRPVGQ